MTTVFTSGCFDIVHAGHVQFLERARALGDRLIVGLNSDDSIRRLKGPERPWNPYGEREAVLKALRSVDAVIPFDEDTPAVLLMAIRPDIAVKGPGYSIENVSEWWREGQYGRAFALPACRHVILPGPDLSTTKLISRIRGNA